MNTPPFLELDLDVELVGKVRDGVAQSEQHTTGSLPLRFSFSMRELIVTHGAEAMPLLIKGACIGEILDFTVTLDAKGPPLIHFTLQSPIHQEFEAVDFHVLANLA